MVLRERCVSRMEIQRVAIVDPRKTYAFYTADEYLTLNTLLILQPGLGKAHFCTPYFIHLSNVTHSACQIRSYSGDRPHACSRIGHHGLLLF